MRRSTAAAVLISILLLTPGCRGDSPPAASATATPATDAATAGNEQAVALVFEDPEDAAVIDAATAHARPENQRVLIHWGSESVERSVALAKLFEDERDVARKLLYEYQVVRLEVGDADHDLGQYGPALEGTAGDLPYLMILDGQGQVVATRGATSLLAGDQFDTKKILGFLDEYQPDYLKAADVLAAALAEAERTDKLVFLHSGAPWCGWCKRLEAWMARPEVAEILAKDFVPLKIDVDRMLGAKAIGDKYVDGYGGVPWIVILDTGGELVADSFDEEGKNIGSPYADWEIEYFGVMLNEVARTISQAEIEALLESLVAAREATS